MLIVKDEEMTMVNKHEFYKTKSIKVPHNV